MSTLLDTFRAAANAHPEKTAIVHETESISYSELNQNIANTQKWLIKNHDLRGPVGLWASNPIDFTTLYLAAAGADLTIVPIDWRATAAEIETQLDECGIVALIADKDLLSRLSSDMLSETVTELPLRDAVMVSMQDSNPQRASLYTADDFVLQYTSGTTGNPKAIVLSDLNIAARVSNWSKAIGLAERDVVLCTLTLAHSHGMDVLMLPGLLHGCTVVAPNLAYLSPRRIAKLIAQHRVTIFSSLPSIYELFVRSVNPDTVDFSGVRYMISGSAPLDVRTAIAFHEKFDHPVSQVYGLSEIGPICFNRAYRTAGDIGYVIPGIDFHIVADVGDETGCGELVVSGLSLARGYLSSPLEQQKMFRGNSLWTNDLVRLTEHRLALQGRRSRFINVAGNKVDPVEVEYAMKALGMLEEVVVIGVDDPIKTQRVIAYVKPLDRHDVCANDLRQLLLAGMAAYKVPEVIHVVKSIPRNSLGKVLISQVGRVEA